eukprot:XP_012822980.1 PREDICTED: uncharacterized protein LOC100496691 [Xenopus tropicalis]
MAATFAQHRREDYSLSGLAGFPFQLEENLAKILRINPADLESVSRYVKSNKEKRLHLPNNLCLRICDLNGTVYMGQNYMLESWKKFYLPKKTNMVVLGTLDNVPCMAPGMQLVVLVSEDGRVFLYEDEELHKAADSLQDFFSGITCTSEVHCRSPSPSPESGDEDEETHKEVLKLRQGAQQFVNKDAALFGSLLLKF